MAKLIIEIDVEDTGIETEEVQQFSYEADHATKISVEVSRPLPGNLGVCGVSREMRIDSGSFKVRMRK